MSLIVTYMADETKIMKKEYNDVFFPETVPGTIALFFYSKMLYILMMGWYFCICHLLTRKRIRFSPRYGDRMPGRLDGGQPVHVKTAIIKFFKQLPLEYCKQLYIFDF